eukprot:190770_1
MATLISDIKIRCARGTDAVALQDLYSAQYPSTIQTQHKSISKYVKKARKTDLKDIHKYYLNKARHGLWVAIDTNNANTIIGMIGIRENRSWTATKQTTNLSIKSHHKKQNSMNDTNRKPDFKLAYQLIDDMIAILTTGKEQHCHHIKSNEAEVMRFGTSINYRRKGIGTALFAHVKQFCIENDYNVIVASTMNVLQDAVQFYKASGFILKHTEPCGYDSHLNFLRFTYNLDNA